MFLLVHEQKDYVIYGGITIFASSASNILNFINAHKYINLRFVGKYNLKRHIKPILIFSFYLVCTQYNHVFYKTILTRNILLLHQDL